MTALQDPPRIEPDVLIEEARQRQRRRRSAYAIVLAAAGLAVGVVVVFVLGPARSAVTESSAHRAPSGALAGGCRSLVRARVLPVWARAGFSPSRQRVPYTLGAKGLILAIPFGPLDSPPAAGVHNKILWVARVENRAARSSLAISAQRMSGTKRLGRPMHQTVAPGPGPSYVNAPAPGCWRLTLRWQGHTDQLDLRYSRPS